MQDKDKSGGKKINSLTAIFFQTKRYSNKNKHR